ncbi:hypothetical protein OsccyDRAFT_0169 [Leptolyngbyaceae cyanobacterium JSC-12]|nr:hypothetical protein OsccyDRAFT_0169 [Leptolyngbyaceae cyanobacterium JSC-12]
MIETSETQAQPQYPVTIWEAIAIVLGAVLLVSMGLIGLMYKFFSNAANPQRASQIASSLMSYRVPEDAQGVFGANLGGAKVAIVSSSSFLKDPASLTEADMAKLSGVELFIARVPLDVETTTPNPTPLEPASPQPTDLFSSPDFSFSYRSGEEFQVSSTRTEDLRFCNKTVPVRIQTGELTLYSELPPVNAVKYDAMVIFDNSKRQVTVTAIGADAEKQATNVFNSLRCK